MRFLQSESLSFRSSVIGWFLVKCILGVVVDKMKNREHYLYNKLCFPSEPQRVDQDGDPQHRRLGEVLQRPHHLPVRPRDLGGGAVRRQDPDAQRTV